MSDPHLLAKVESPPCFGRADPLAGSTVTGWFVAGHGEAFWTNVAAFIDGAPAGHAVSLPPGTPHRSAPAGARAFSYSIPQTYKDGLSHLLCLAFDDGTAVEFTNGAGGVSSALRFRFEVPHREPAGRGAEQGLRAAEPSDPAAGKTEFAGIATLRNNTTVTGWAVSRREPGRPVRLRVFVDAHPAATVLCQLPHAALRDLGLETQTGGFAYDLPARWRDGDNHTLSILFDDGSTLPFTDADRHARSMIIFRAEPAGAIPASDGNVAAQADADQADADVGGQTQVESGDASAQLEPSHQGRAAQLPAMVIRLEESRVSGRGILRVRGWAVSSAPLQHVQVFLDDRLLGLAESNLLRADVALSIPDYPNSDNAGFLFVQEITDAELKGQVIRVTSVALGGITRSATAPLVVAPVIHRREHQDASVRFHCDDVWLSEDGTVFAEGWALAPSGIDSIVIAVDGVPAGTAQIGLDRPDVGNSFPLVPSARIAGFRFAKQLQRRCEGEHVIAFALRGYGGEEVTKELPVRAKPSAASAADDDDRSPDIRLFVDRPLTRGGVATAPARGNTTVVGWALARNGIESVEILLNGASIGPAYYGMRREDIQAAFPLVEGSLRSGFAASIACQALPEGRHAVRIVATDKAGRQAEYEFHIDVEPVETSGPWSLRTKLQQTEADVSLAILGRLDYKPTYFVLLVLRSGDEAELRRLAATIASLRDQAYCDWTLAIVLRSGSDLARVQPAALRGHEDISDRLVFISDGQLSLRISALLPSRVEQPVFLSLLRPGDVFGADALLELSVASGLHRDAEFIYGDERRYDAARGMVDAYFKPDWSPDLLLSSNYIGRPWIATSALLARVGATLAELQRYGEYDLVLRLTESAAAIHHVQTVLCERAAISLDSVAAEKRALQRVLKRRGIEGTILDGCLPGVYRLKRAVLTRGLVSIIIPTVAARGLIKTAIETIREKTVYRNFEIICLDNIPATEPDWKKWLRENADKVVEIREKFNWSRFNNKGAKHASGEFLLFLNDDIEIHDPHWLDALLEHAQRPEVGVVGPQLLYPDGKVQHAGLFLSKVGGRHAFRFSASDEPGPFGLALTQRNVIGVTGACMLMRRDAFEEVGGFDEAHSVVNNDLDYCLKARSKGQRVLYTPHTRIVHHELASRAAISDKYDKAGFVSQWGNTLQRGDPFFSPLLSLERDDYNPELEPVRVIHAGFPLISRARVRRILALKLDHIGDFITAIPALNRLKERFAEAELTVLTPRASLSIARLVPAIDRCIEFNFFHSRSALGQRRLSGKMLAELRDTLRSCHFDIAIDLRRQPETRHVLQYTGAKWLVGYDHRSQFPWLDIALEWEGDIIQTAKRAQVADTLVQLVDSLALACEPKPGALLDTLTQDVARAQIAALPAVAPLASTLFEGPLICVHPTVGALTRQWPVEHFAALIDLLVEGEGAKVVLIGGPGETRTAEQVMAHVTSRDHTFSLIGKTGLGDLPALLQACDLFVGNNSGPQHIAAALGVPTVGVHSGVVDAAEWGPSGPAAVAIRRDMMCGPCYIAKPGDCHRNLACLRGLRPGDVFRACQRMLALRTPAHSRLAREQLQTTKQGSLGAIRRAVMEGSYVGSGS
jgi:ADP-heptose:LPS heptosyltransferase/GT2 family glycosyltransferase